MSLQPAAWYSKPGMLCREQFIFPTGERSKVMNKFLTKGKAVKVRLAKAIPRIMAVAISTAVMGSSQVYASDVITSGTFNTGNADNLTNLMGSIIGMMLTIARYAGMALTIWGIVKTVMAYKDDNVNEITQGIRLAIVGIFLVALKSILTGVGILTG